LVYSETTLVSIRKPFKIQSSSESPSRVPSQARSPKAEIPS
jgi:hypothetical protein